MKIDRKTLTMLALCTTLAIVLCASAFAAEVVDSGQCGDNVYWELDSDGVLTINGTGKMQDYSFQNKYYPSWYYTEIMNEGKVTTVIVDGISNIGNFAFWECHNIEKVVLPSNISTVGTAAFSGCSSLKDIYFGDRKPIGIISALG